MERRQLEHIIRAAAGITGADEFVVIGSQAILGQFPDAPAELLVSHEADLFTLRNPDDADLIDGSIGEASPFHRSFGYYAHGVGPETATLPSGWKERLVPIRNENTGKAAGLCLEVHDLAISKLIPGREKDLDFIQGLLKHRMVDVAVMEKRLVMTPISGDMRDLCLARLRRLSG
jgi:hypothetical protein